MTTASSPRTPFPRRFPWPFGRGRAVTPPMDALYRAVVAEARDPAWYRSGGVPDTIDGRFDMLALVLSLVLLRLQRSGRAADEVALTERFIDDMDGQMREVGFGDMVVGKQVGRVVSALGGRLGAYADGVTRDALVRNLWRGTMPPEDAATFTEARLATLGAALDAVPVADLLEGRLR